MKDSIVVIGADQSDCVIDASLDPNYTWEFHTAILAESVSDCKVENISVINLRGSGIVAIRSGLIVERIFLHCLHQCFFCRYSSNVKIMNAMLKMENGVGVGVLDSSSVTIIASIITKSTMNSIEIIRNSNAILENTILYDAYLHGLRVVYNSKATVMNSVIWPNNYGIDHTESNPDSICINYSNISPDLQGNLWLGIGNIYENPQFIDPASNNFMLQPSSPCIDAGNSDAIFNDLDGSRNDMGAYGGPYGSWQITKIDNKNRKERIPIEFNLYQNYPNPFNPTTTVDFSMPVASKVTISAFNLLGRKVRTLLDGNKNIGVHRISWDGRHDTGAQLPAGVYLCRMEAGDFVKTIKMVLVR